MPSQLEERVTRLEVAFLALVQVLKAGGAGGIHAPDEHPLDDVLKQYQAS